MTLLNHVAEHALVALAIRSPEALHLIDQRIRLSLAPLSVHESLIWAHQNMDEQAWDIFTDRLRTYAGLEGVAGDDLRWATELMARL